MRTLFLLMIGCSISFCQSYQIKTREQSKQNYYYDAIFLSQGKPQEETNLNSDAAMRVYRVVITAQLVNMNAEEGYHIYLEELSLGTEGAKLHLIASRSVEPGEIMTKYKIESETWGLQFIKWLSPTSFAFKLAGNKFKLENINRSKVTISKIN